jgi:hypothetical protein
MGSFFPRVLDNDGKAEEEVKTEVRRMSKNLDEISERLERIEKALKCVLEKGNEKNDADPPPEAETESRSNASTSPVLPAKTYAQVTAQSAVKQSLERGGQSENSSKPATKKDAILPRSEAITSEKKVTSNDMTKAEVDMTNAEVPRVGVLCDSILKGVSFVRLGRSYGFQAKTVNARDTSQVSKAADEMLRDGSIEALVVHTGINNLRDPDSDARKLGSKLAQTVREVAAKHTKLRVIVSQVAPVRDRRMDQRRKLFNASLAAELKNTSNVYMLQHQFYTKHLHADGIHPRQSGSSIIAASLGRLLHGLLWEKQNHRRPHLRHQGNAARPAWFDGPFPLVYYY